MNGMKINEQYRSGLLPLDLSLAKTTGFSVPVETVVIPLPSIKSSSSVRPTNLILLLHKFVKQ